MVASKRLPSFIDFEASGLGQHSYPIEVGWSDRAGNIRSMLIRPTGEWFEEPLAWDLNAQALHGILFWPSFVSCTASGSSARSYPLEVAWTTPRERILNRASGPS